MYKLGGPDANFFQINTNQQIVISNAGDLALQNDTKYTVSVVTFFSGDQTLLENFLVTKALNKVVFKIDTNI